MLKNNNNKLCFPVTIFSHSTYCFFFFSCHGVQLDKSLILNLMIVIILGEKFCIFFYKVAQWLFSSCSPSFQSIPLPGFILFTLYGEYFILCNVISESFNSAKISDVIWFWLWNLFYNIFPLIISELSLTN